MLNSLKMPPRDTSHSVEIRPKLAQSARKFLGSYNSQNTTEFRNYFGGFRFKSHWILKHLDSCVAQVHFYLGYTVIKMFSSMVSYGRLLRGSRRRGCTTFPLINISEDTIIDVVLLAIDSAREGLKVWAEEPLIPSWIMRLKAKDLEPLGILRVEWAWHLKTGKSLYCSR